MKTRSKRSTAGCSPARHGGSEGHPPQGFRDLFRELVETSRDLICTTDAEGRFAYVNPAWELALGYRPEKMLGRPFKEFLAPECVDRDLQQFSRLMAGNTVSGHETTFVGEAGRRVRVVFGVAFTTTDGTVLHMNGAGLRLTGYASVEEVRALPASTFYGDPAGRQQIVDLLLKDGAVHAAELQARRKDGTLFWIAINAVLLRDAGGRPKHVLALFHDISARRRMESELRDSECRFRRTFDQCPIGAAQVSVDGRFLLANEALGKMLGYTAEQMVGLHFEKITHPDHVAGDTAAVNRVLSGEIDHYDTDKRYVHRDGHTVWGHLSLRLVRDEGGRPLYFLPMVVDLTERRKAEETLRESTALLSSVGDNLPDVMLYQIVRDREGRRRFTYVSAAVRRFYGCSPEEAMADPERIYGRVLEEDRERIHREEERAFEAFRPFASEARMKAPSGEVRWSFFASNPRKLEDGSTSWDGIEMDVTDRRRAEESLRTVQKLESLGIMAGGIAHDFNNLLAGVFGNLDLARRRSQDPRVARHLDEALAVLDRARALTQQLLTFAKGGAPLRRCQSLAPPVRDAVRFSLSGSNVTARLDLPDDLWPCEFDEHQIGQVIDNLVINAQQAMPTGGSMTVAARNVTVADRKHPFLPAGRYVTVSITDTGTGIPSRLRARIFDPFFTTKQKGSGLGLAMAHSIVRQHGGCIDLESELGLGSTFHVTLPAATGEAQAPAAEAITDPSGCGRILVMDDEQMILTLMKAILETLGYTMVGVNDGAQLIQTLEDEAEAGRTFAAVILDLTVRGGMGGVEAIAEIRRLDATIPVFVSSGFSVSPVLARPRDHGFTDSIPKPYKVADVARVLERHLKKARSPDAPCGVAGPEHRGR
ncbi:MAG: PAS domain S-box protein [Candidatus Riflebacteria bacterium]|nr:PAS domain S-box protein [Candidatus Riflebacteria bacterium]